MEKKFGAQEINSAEEQYSGPSNEWWYHEKYDDEHEIIVEYDVDNGTATISTQLKKKEHLLE